ncbi:hypothetical protein LR48_Vigan10g027500 [Vigna angularis]|uniref:Uncharacterized protein n=1 Tax=Phaseolus angularis TaxID=3914 RepID=A0A0L9VHB2_PHAAN|nr:hypothetical protein LR48_Vigan10g027500 [Vigna angularis]
MNSAYNMKKTYSNSTQQQRLSVSSSYSSSLGNQENLRLLDLANREGSHVLHVLRVQQPQETVSRDSERGLENLPGERDSLAFGDENIEMIENQGVVELIAVGARVGVVPSGDKLAKVKLRLGGHVGWEK